MESESPETIPGATFTEKLEAPRLIAMIDYDGREPPRNHPEREAEAAWAAVSSLWHPSLLAVCDELPGIEGVEFPAVPEFRETRVMAEAAASRLPADYRRMIESIGTRLIEGGIDREKIVGDLLAALGLEDSRLDIDDPLVLDFFALGTARWMLRDLTMAMGHADCLDITSLTRESLAGARAWTQGDRAAATGNLRAAFELLTQAREKYYPVDAYLIDICLVDKTFPAGALDDPISSRSPVTFLASGEAIERLAEIDADGMASIRQGVHEGWADVIGGTYAESDESLLPITSILWQFLKGSEVYRKNLDDRNVETLATRRFALYHMRPQIGRRFGFRFALHMGFDSGKFPIPRESKRLWDAPDGSHLETLMRPPMSADRPSEGLRLPWRIGKTMKDDHVATIPLLHWPLPLAGWYRDLRRTSAYSPVLAKWVTAGDFFHMSDRPWEMFKSTYDDYVSPYLAQAVARDDQTPISRSPQHVRNRAALDAVYSLDALHRALTTLPTTEEREFGQKGPLVAADLGFADLEHRLESLSDGEEIPPRLHEVAVNLAAAICGTGPGESGFLILNPTSSGRLGVVDLGGVHHEVRPGAQVRAVQHVEGSTHVVIDVPPFGFAWFPRSATDGESLVQVSAAGTFLKNDRLEVEINPASGGIRGVKASGEPIARLGQQLVISGLSDGETSRMEADSVEVIHNGPALGQIRSIGRIVSSNNGTTLARFTQDVQIWAGKPSFQLNISLDDLDPTWLASRQRADPWTAYLACRWAWPDGKSVLRRSSQGGIAATSAERPETPDAFEIGTKNQKTTLLFGGLSHHKRHGERMLDTLLIAGQETGRTFRLGVALEIEYAYQAAIDLTAPLPVVATETGPPKIGPAGWLLRVESGTIHLPRIEFLETTGDGKGWGIAVYLVETSGRSVRTRLRIFRDPLDARQTDFAGELIYDLPCEGDAVPVDLTPFEMVRVEIRLG